MWFQTKNDKAIKPFWTNLTNLFEFNHRNFILGWSFRFFVWTAWIWRSHHWQTSPQFDCIEILGILHRKWKSMLLMWNIEGAESWVEGSNVKYFFLPCSSAPEQIQFSLLPFWCKVDPHVDVGWLCTALTIKVDTWSLSEQVPEM